MVVSAFVGGIGTAILGERAFLLIVGILILVVMLCSGFLAWYEFQDNPISETERGEWAGKALLYAIVFTITFFLAFLYLPTLYFG